MPRRRAIEFWTGCKEVHKQVAALAKDISQKSFQLIIWQTARPGICIYTYHKSIQSLLGMVLAQDLLQIMYTFCESHQHTVSYEVCRGTEVGETRIIANLQADLHQDNCWLQPSHLREDGRIFLQHSYRGLVLPEWHVQLKNFKISLDKISMAWPWWTVYRISAISEFQYHAELLC